MIEGYKDLLYSKDRALLGMCDIALYLLDHARTLENIVWELEPYVEGLIGVGMTDELFTLIEARSNTSPYGELIIETMRDELYEEVEQRERE